jgi:hypothetical protein
MTHSAADRLEARIATAITLRQFDEDSRRMRIQRIVGRIARERKMITETLIELGGAPWPYSSVGDNSWLP